LSWSDLKINDRSTRSILIVIAASLKFKYRFFTTLTRQANNNNTIDSFIFRQTLQQTSSLFVNTNLRERSLDRSNSSKLLASTLVYNNSDSSIKQRSYSVNKTWFISKTLSRNDSFQKLFQEMIHFKNSFNNYKLQNYFFLIYKKRRKFLYKIKQNIYNKRRLFLLFT